MDCGIERRIERWLRSTAGVVCVLKKVPLLILSRTGNAVRSQCSATSPFCTYRPMISPSDIAEILLTSLHISVNSDLGRAWDPFMSKKYRTGWYLNPECMNLGIAKVVPETRVKAVVHEDCNTLNDIYISGCISVCCNVSWPLGTLLRTQYGLCLCVIEDP